MIERKQQQKEAENNTNHYSYRSIENGSIYAMAK